MLAARLLVERRLAQGPLLVIVDDLHWADAASVDLLREVADQLADRPLMLLVAHRPDARAPASRGAEPTAIRARRRCSATTTRARWSAACSARRRRPAFARLRDLVAARAGGNPLFVEEIVRSLVGGGVLVREGERWVASATRRDGEPAADRCTACCCRASTGCRADDRRVLQEAAVLGAELRRGAAAGGRRRAAPTAPRCSAWSRPTWCARGPADGPALALHATRCCTRWSTRTSCWRGAPSCTSAPAARSSRRVGPSPRRGTQPMPGDGRSATTGAFAATRPRGARYLTAAGDRARAVYANDDAIRHYERALATLRRLPATLRRPRRAARCASGWPTCWRSPGGAPRRWRTTSAVRAELAGGAERAGAARLLRKIGALHWEAGDRERAGACFDAGLGGLGEDGDPIERAHLYQELGPARLPRRRQRRRDRAGPSGRLPRLARAGTPSDGERERETAATQVAGLQHARRRAGAHGPARGGGRRGSSRASRWPRRTTCCRRPAAATPTSACCRARSIRRAASRPASAASRSRARSATSASSRGCTPTSRWPTAR